MAVRTWEESGITGIYPAIVITNAIRCSGMAALGCRVSTKDTNGIYLPIERNAQTSLVHPIPKRQENHALISVKKVNSNLAVKRGGVSVYLLRCV
jgi:hypothetical protein